jgi:hypothetical protein
VKLLCSFIGFALAHSAHAQQPSFDWVKQLPNSGNAGLTEGQGVTTDAQGNVFGATYQSVHDPSTQTLAVKSVVTKLSPQGTVLWSLPFPSYVRMTTAKDGTLCLSGPACLQFGGQPDCLFDASGITTVGSGANYVARVDVDGNLQWVRLIGDNPSSTAEVIGVDDQGGYIVQGAYFTGTAQFGNTVLPAPADQGVNFYLARYTANGDATWAALIGQMTGLLGGLDLVRIDGDGNFYVAGAVGDTFTVGSSVFTGTADGNPREFLVKLDPQGNFLWSRQTDDRGGSIALDVAGNVFMASLSDAYDLHIVKYSPSGDLLWSHQPTHTGAAGMRFNSATIAADADGNCIAAGDFFSGSVSFDSWTITGGTHQDLFVVKYSSAGAVRWAVSPQPSGSGETSDTDGGDLAVGADGSIFVTGDFAGTIQFSANALVASPFGSGGVPFLTHISDPDKQEPTLKILESGPKISISWNTASGFILESTDSLADPTSWTAETVSPVVTGSESTVTLDHASTGRFFRLRKP